MNDIVQIFNQVRDIPYKIPTSFDETDCCCSGKHKLLQKLLKNIGYQSRYRVVSFKWDSLKLPQRVLSINHENLITHVYLEVLIKNKWLDMDATWDSGLKNVLPVNKWDGSKNIIAVPIVKKFSLKKSQKIMENESEEEIIKDLKINGKFYQAFNNWLEEIRQL